MKKPPVDVQDVLERYAAGYFPMVDENGVFFWDRWAVRAVLPVDQEVAARARRMLRRAQGAGEGRFEIRYLTVVEEVVGHLRHVKENSWVQGDVVEIYRALHAAGLLWTLEAWEKGRLVGGLLGVILPGVFVAETMYGVVPEASKVCLCQLVADCWGGGRRRFEMIDVQTPHDRDEMGELTGRGVTAHPCVRLGERQVAFAEFLAALRGAWGQTFAGGVREWMEVAQGVGLRARVWGLP